MKVQLSPQRAIESAVPWVHLSLLCMGAVLILWGEVRAVRINSDEALEAKMLIESLEAKNKREDLDFSVIEGQSGEVVAANKDTLRGLSSLDSDEPDLDPLKEKGLVVFNAVIGGGYRRMMLHSNGVEFHSILPVIQRQEEAVPMARWAKVSLKSNSIPFCTSAQRLQIDLELTIPKAAVSATVQAVNPESADETPEAMADKASVAETP